MNSEALTKLKELEIKKINLQKMKKVQTQGGIN